MNKLSKKKVLIDEIESIEVKKSVFGKKVTLSQEDYEKLEDASKKYVSIEKTTKKLKAENADIAQKYAELKKMYDSVSAELTEKKKPAYLSRQKINNEAKRLAEQEQKEKKLRKAMAFISACGLSEDFVRFKFNKTRNSELE